MPEFRIEAVPDGAGMYAAELYYPIDAKAPIGRTGAVYTSPEEVRRRIEDAFFAFFNTARRELQCADAKSVQLKRIAASAV